MPHISKKRLNSEFFQQIFDKLIVVLGKAYSHKKLSPILDELLTETEKIMLAKRLAAILMLSGNIPQHRISEVLLMSPSTITRISLGLEIGKFELITNLSQKERVDIEKIIWLLLTAGGILPPRAGGKYWRKRGYKYALQK